MVKEKDNKEKKSKKYKEKSKFYYLGGIKYGLGMKYDDEKEKEDYFSLSTNKPKLKDKKLEKIITRSINNESLKG